MQVNITLTGKTEQNYLPDAIEYYVKKIKHYIPVNIHEIPDIKGSKNITADQLKEKESEVQLKKIEPKEFLILLDEKGSELSSREFADFLQQKMNSGIKSIHFLAGGPFGFSDKLYERANYKLSLSKMTFSHQMVRLFFIEQLYRALSIIRNEKYHHD